MILSTKLTNHQVCLQQLNWPQNKQNDTTTWKKYFQTKKGPEPIICISIRATILKHLGGKVKSHHKYFMTLGVCRNIVRFACLTPLCPLLRAVHWFLFYNSSPRPPSFCLCCLSSHPCPRPSQSSMFCLQLSGGIKTLFFFSLSLSYFARDEIEIAYRTLPIDLPPTPLSSSSTFAPHFFLCYFLTFVQSCLLCFILFSLLCCFACSFQGIIYLFFESNQNKKKIGAQLFTFTMTFQWMHHVSDTDCMRGKNENDRIIPSSLTMTDLFWCQCSVPFFPYSLILTTQSGWFDEYEDSDRGISFWGQISP